MVDQVEPAAPAAPVAPAIAETPAVSVVASPSIVPDAPAVPDTPAPSSKAWGDDWRQQLAGEDKSYLKTLERFTDPPALAKAHRELQAKLSSGDYKKAAPAKDASPEEIAAWKKESGVPVNVEDYKITPPAGVVFGDADKPMLDSFTQHAHAEGWTNDTLNQAIAWYGQQQEAALAKLADADDQFKGQAAEALRDMWPGQEYHRNLNAAKSLVHQLPQEFQDIFASARTTDGKILGDHPTILATMAQLAREINPAATVVPAGVADVGKSISDELKSLQGMMGDKSSEYWRGPKANDMQARYRTLLDAQSKMASRAA